MSEMKCSDILKELSNYIEGDIPPELMAALEEHVCTCEHCRIVLDTTRKTISLYHHHADTQQASDEVVEHLYKTLNLDDYLPRKVENG
jgi:hypothetical protein